MDVPVATFQFAYQPAFGVLPASQQPVRTDLIGKTGKKQRITAKAAEHPAQFPYVGTEQAVALCAAYLMGQPFTGQKFVPVPDVGQVLLFAVPTLIEFGAGNGSLKRGKPVYSQPPGRLLSLSLCRVYTGQEQDGKEAWDKSYAHLAFFLFTTSSIISFTSWPTCTKFLYRMRSRSSLDLNV